MRIEMEDRIKLKETEFKQELQRSKGIQEMGHEFYPKSKTVKLPKLDFQKFTGDILKWKEFIDCFTGAIDQNPTLSNVDKFNYLKAKLEGEALSSIAGIELTNDNYSVALKILTERFGNRQVCVDAHYNRLVTISPAH